MKFDEQLSQRVSAMYASADIAGRRQSVMRALAAVPGERILDIGSGPGLMTEELAGVVGKDGQVSGLDSSESMVAVARTRCARLPHVDVRLADATSLPYDDQSFDGAVCVQVLEYIPKVERALAEIYRVLRAGGRAVIVDTDWASIVWHATDNALMDRVMSAWEEHVHHPHLPRTLSSKLRAAGLHVDQRSTVAMFNPCYEENSISGGLIDIVSSFVQGRRGVSEHDARRWADDLRTLGARGEYFFSLTQYLFLVSKPDTNR